MRVCSVEDCNEPHEGLGFCKKHYQRFKRHGKTTRNAEMGPQEYFEEIMKAETDECNSWPFMISKHNGYARVKFNGKTKYAHQFACERVHGPKPFPEAQVRHLCGNGSKGCFNPRHLVWGTAQENAEDRDEHETTNRGRGVWTNVVSEDIVLEIYNSKEKGIYFRKKYDISATIVSGIRTGKSWAWLTGHPKKEKRAA